MAAETDSRGRTEPQRLCPRGRRASSAPTGNHSITTRVVVGTVLLLHGFLTTAVNAQPAIKPVDKLRVATRQTPPFAMRDADGRWRGISIELLQAVREQLKSATGAAPEIEFAELSIEAMLRAVEQGEADLAAAALSVNLEREKRVDFSHPYFKSGLGIAVAEGENRQGLFGLVRSILSPTFLQIVAGLVLTMLGTGVAVYYFERRKNREQFGGGAIRGIASGLWWSAVTLTTVGYGDKVPKTVGGRLIGMVWMFSGLFIIASFTAAVTSSLTITQLRSRVTGPADLARVRVATVAESTSSTFLRSRRVAHRKLPDIATALASLREGQVDAVVYDAPVLRYEVHERSSGDLRVLPVTFEDQDYAFALPEGSPYREPLNQAILRQIASPEWDEMLRRYFGDHPE